ncbi:hypothetical protein HYS82_00780 [Candidatus Amesbacteria bacterium]|nr:hypothetical protein [Candidatus Amesbacteria bacterium]MBI2587496.1 hypothetical protein [Candidatus Amesbacteria bacterium]
MAVEEVLPGSRREREARFTTFAAESAIKFEGAGDGEGERRKGEEQ